MNCSPPRLACWGVVLPVFLFGLPGLLQAAPALLEQTDVFVAGQDGVFEYRIPGIIISNQGTLIAFCDARMRKEGDPPNDIDLVMKRSVDGGRTWGPLRTLVDNGPGAAADSCGFVDRQTGTLWIFSVYAPEGVGSYNAADGLAAAGPEGLGFRSGVPGPTRFRATPPAGRRPGHTWSELRLSPLAP